MLNFTASNKFSTAFWGALLITFFIGLAAPRMLAFLPSLTGLVFAGILLITHKKFLCPQKDEILLFSLALLLIFSSSFWAPDQAFGIERSFKIALIILPCALLLNIARHIEWPKTISILPVLVGIHFIAAMFFLTEKTTDHQILEFILNKPINSFKLNRSFIVFILFTQPLLFLIQISGLEKIKKASLFAFVFLLTTAALMITESQTAQLTFIIGIFFLLFFPIKNHLIFKALVACIILVTLILPFAIGPIKSALPEQIFLESALREASIIPRLEVWNYAAEKAIDSPIYGNGVEALRFMKADQIMEHQGGYNALHAHNVVLQIWAEFGLIGITLGIAFLLYICRSIDRVQSLQIKKLYLSIFMACFSVALTGYGFWQGWQMGLFFLVACLSLAIGNAHKEKI